MKKNTKKRVVGITGGVLLFFAVIGLAWMLIAFRSTAAPITASDKFLRAFLANDTERAYAMTNDTFKASTDRDSFNQVAEQVSGIIDKKSLKITTGNVEDNDDGTKVATFYYDVTAKDEPYRLTIKMIKPLDADVWQVLSVDNKLSDNK